jgi:hypothetical protein
MIWQCQTCLLGEDGQIGDDMEADLDKLVDLRKDPLELALLPPLREITGANENEHDRHHELALAAPVKGHTGVQYSLDEALIDMGLYSIVQEYTKRSLSYATDLLPTISALAGEVQKLTKATYLAGLWALDTPPQIPIRSFLWYSVKPNTRANNGPPSWAWSSVLGPVSHPCLGMIRFDHPGVIIENVAIEEPSKEAKKSIPLDEAKPNGPRIKLVSKSRRKIRYEHTNSQIQILAVKINLASSNILGQLRDASPKISGLVHSYTGAADYDYAREPVSPYGKFALTEVLDTDEPTRWHRETHVLLCVAEFRENATNWLSLAGNASN